MGFGVHFLCLGFRVLEHLRFKFGFGFTSFCCALWSSVGHRHLDADGLARHAVADPLRPLASCACVGLGGGMPRESHSPNSGAF